jgi:DNA-binding transcriptional ArsR family regulator
VDQLACCQPLADAPLSAEGAHQLAGVLKALADPARLRLLSLIQAREGAEACVCHLTEPLGLTQPTVSHYLKVLHEAGLLAPRAPRGVGLLPGRVRRPTDHRWPPHSPQPGDRGMNGHTRLSLASA